MTWEDAGADLPPGQYLTADSPVLSAGPTPLVPLDGWELTVTTETGEQHTWGRQDLLTPVQQEIVVDLHCVTRWSKSGTTWRGFRWTRFSSISRLRGLRRRLVLRGVHDQPSPRRPMLPTCYVCGPTGFVELMAGLLVELGHDSDRIRTERFGPTGGRS